MMDNFCCDICGKELVMGPAGKYITECEHYQLEDRGTDLSDLPDEI